MKKFSIFVVALLLMLSGVGSVNAEVAWSSNYNTYYQRSQHTYSWHESDEGTYWTRFAPAIYILYKDEADAKKDEEWDFFSKYKYPFTLDNNQYYLTLCADLVYDFWPVKQYNVVDITESTIIKEEIKGNLTAIARHAYPFITIDDMTDNLIKAGVLVETTNSAGQKIYTAKANTDKKNLYMSADNQVHFDKSYSDNTESDVDETIKMEDSEYYYSTEIKYEDGTYTLVNPTKYQWKNASKDNEKPDNSFVVGKYTCYSQGSESCSSPKHIDKYVSEAVYDKLEFTINRDELLSGTQMAIFNYTDPTKVDERYYQTVGTLSHNFPVIDRKANYDTDGYYPTVKNNIDAVYNYLIGLPAEENQKTLRKAEAQFDEIENVYYFRLTLNGKGSPKDELKADFMLDDTVVASVDLTDDTLTSDGTYIFKTKKVKDIKNLKIRLSGKAYVENNVLAFEAQDGREDSQTLIGVKASYQEIEQIYDKGVVLGEFLTNIKVPNTGDNVTKYVLYFTSSLCVIALICGLRKKLANK